MIYLYELLRQKKQEIHLTHFQKFLDSMIYFQSEKILPLSLLTIRMLRQKKATVSAEKSVYVFKIDPKATKRDVEKAFKEKYKVSPLKVSTVTIPAKNVFVRGKRGKKSGYKKAYVYLKKGEKIEII